MSSDLTKNQHLLPRGVMFNAYPDSIGRCLADTLAMLKRPEFEGVFSLFYVLPTFFHSDLDRGFSVVDYDMNEALVRKRDLKALRNLGIELKFDLVLNHLSVGSPQFQDLVKKGDKSRYRDFFIDWNEFWQGEGGMGPEGHLLPKKEHLAQLFMRKPDLPILKVRFPDGSERPYWNTFYQETGYPEITPEDLEPLHLGREDAELVADAVNGVIAERGSPRGLDLGVLSEHDDAVIGLVEGKRRYLGQMDLNARSDAVWAFYDETLKKLKGYGAKLVRLDAFAYLHKAPGLSNFFNTPGTWEYLDRLKRMAARHDLVLLPEIHAEYGYGLHEAVAARGFPVYDFFFPGLVIDALDRGTARHLVRWIRELVDRQICTVNMLGCHDGIPVLDLKGGRGGDAPREGLLSDAEIDAIVGRVMDRGGRVKNLYGPDGRKIAYYQVNATFFSALGEDERKMRLARAIQMFMPGIPQVWYLDLFAGRNDYAAADAGGTAGHKEINRTTLQHSDIEQGLKRILVQDQLQLMRLRNNSPAFDGELEIHNTDAHCLHLTWKNGGHVATLNADLASHCFCITHRDDAGVDGVMSYR